MNKLKEKAEKFYATLKKSIEKFPLTMITVFVLTLIYAIDLGTNFIDPDILLNMTIFGFTFADGAFLIETISKEKRKKILGYIISVVYATIFTYIFVCPDVIEMLLPKNVISWVEHLFYCSTMSFFILAIYFNYKRSMKSFEQYVTSVFVNVFKTSIVYAILALGSAIVTSIFIYLILGGSTYTLLGRIEILVLGIYYIPALLYSLYNIEEKNSKFSKVVIKYVLGTLVIIAFAIIYIYIIKIIILRDMPSNQIFRILAALFILGCPIWTMMESFKENTIIDKINNLLPKLFIPFIFLQIYSIGVRILNNGFTENRYLCIMLIIFEIIYVVMYLIKKEDIGKIVLVFTALMVVSTVVPYVNMYKVSQISQYNILKTFKENNTYTEEEKKKIYGAYKYLINSDEGKELVENLLTENDKEIISDINMTNPSDKYEYMRADVDMEYINIAEYGKLYNVYSYCYLDNPQSIVETFENVELRNSNDDNDILNIDLSREISEYIQYGDNLDDNFENINEIQIDNKKKLILTSIYIYYDKNSKEIEDYRLTGYLLLK